ncbi:MAG TPA: ssDNA-binding protein, partial [Nitrosospira sp.]
MADELKTGKVLREAEGKYGAVIITPEFRVSFPYVFEPQESLDAQGKPRKRYSLVMLFPSDADLKLLKKALYDVAVYQFGPDTKTWPQFRNPLKDQADKAVKFKGYQAGCLYASAVSKEKPGLVGPDRVAICEPSQFYAGCWARATINPYFYDAKGKGFSFGLRNLQKTRDGEPLGNRSNPEDDFELVEVGADSGGPGAAMELGNIFG